ncbi:hypothetical protein DFP72DRAFT_1077565 [Ephemerocybe angulata]|uniref:DUF6593 domain-containing protein n=1 Tax=Ephemerocybe angulata TaxID=980116 RepID=A0A8H6HFB0_9AGAR|nr:hypothetical protein DFP72DRAFT_1018599 [Tulosesus angulatus]KAF6745421.1 hypothetical protein DFP72DRAFT_1077565 [Tulosesus angulatus]
MSGENPFAQWDSANLGPTSIYGALPSGPSNYGLPMGFLSAPMTDQAVGAASQMQITTFHFLSATHTVLNSTIAGPQGQKYFTIATHGVGHTMIINEQAGSTRGEAVGRIEWQKSPCVSLMGAVARQTAGQWLHWSGDRKYRTMTARGKEYSWVFNTGMFFLYTAGNSPSEFVARIVKGRGGDGGVVSLDITTKAVQSGLLDVCVLAAVLFVSGRNLD